MFIHPPGVGLLEVFRFQLCSGKSEIFFAPKRAKGKIFAGLINHEMYGSICSRGE
jgi:hypothetical protein